MKTPGKKMENGPSGTPLVATACGKLRALPSGLCVSAVALLLSLCPAHAQSYSIDWFTIDAGGGTSTAGAYSVGGTIGQPDGGPAMNGGDFSLSGGFLSLLSVVQTPGAPTLSILPGAPGNATVSWAPNTPGFVLQETWSLLPSHWTNSPSGTTNPATLPTSASKFFRLIKSN